MTLCNLTPGREGNLPAGLLGRGRRHALTIACVDARHAHRRGLGGDTRTVPGQNTLNIIISRESET